MADSTIETREAHSARAFFAEAVWARLEIPMAEIIVHTIVTVFSILSIAGIEALLHWFKLDGKYIPHTQITLSEWMFYLEISAATLIIIIGIIKAVIGTVRG